jgi:hypothetical protein
MTEALKTRNVFIDTQAYKNEHLRFDHPKLKRLRQLGASGAINIYATDTVVGEVRADIAEKMAAAAKGLSDFRGKAEILQGFATGNVAPYFLPITERELAERANAIWNDFLASANVTVFDSSSIDVRALLEAYFAGSPPFGAGKKKSEFPDAISTLSIDRWAANTAEAIYVISGDPDFTRWCESRPYVHHLNGISAFLDIFNKAEKEELLGLVEEIYEREQEKIESIIRDSFLNCEFEYPERANAEVNDVVIKYLSINEMSVIEAESGSASLSIQVQIEFTALISGPNYEDAIWDREDKKYVYIPDFDQEMDFNENYDVSLELVFDPESEEIIEVDKLMFDDKNRIELPPFDDGFPYK